MQCIERTRPWLALCVLVTAGCHGDGDAMGPFGYGVDASSVLAVDASAAFAHDSGQTPAQEAGSTVNDSGAVGGDSAIFANDASQQTDSSVTIASKLPPVTSVDAAGPFQTTIDMNAGPGGGWVVRPSELGKDGLTHPIFIWGPGAGAAPTNYRDHLTRIASHGFVVYSEVSTGDGTEMKAAIDWLIAEHARSGSPYYQKLDTTKIAAGGHSRGSLSTFGVASDVRLTTTIHVAGGSFDGTGSKNLRKPAAMICGASDTLATPNAERDYTMSTMPTFLTVMDGVDHINAAREGLGVMVAWLRWQLAGEAERKSQFVGSSCAFCTGKFKSQSKNF